MTKVAIVKHNGLFYGGTEKFLQIMAGESDHSKYEIDFYTTDEMKSDDREKYLIDHDVNIIKFKKYNYKLPWGYEFNSYGDFWSKFKRQYYDVVQITNFGWQERPYNQFKGENVCEFTVFQPYVKFPGVKHHILNSNWLQDEWIKTGGSYENSTVIPVPVRKTTNDNLRDELGIDKTTIVCGFHQRNDDAIFSLVQLQAYKYAENVLGDGICMLVLNGSRLYKQQAKNLKLKNIKFIDYMDNVSKFLNTLDIYTHGRKDGETYGMVLAEAMLHGLPVISHISPNYNAMQSVIGNGGIVTNYLNDYIFEICAMAGNKVYRNNLSSNALKIANENYTYEKVMPRIEHVWDMVANG